MTQLTKREQIALEMFSLRGRLLLDESVNDIIEFSVSAADRFLKHLAETEPVAMTKEDEEFKARLRSDNPIAFPIGHIIEPGMLVRLMDSKDNNTYAVESCLSIGDEGIIEVRLTKNGKDIEIITRSHWIYPVNPKDHPLHPDYYQNLKDKNLSEKLKQPEYPRPIDSPDSRPMNAEEIADWVMRCYESGSTPSSLAYYINILVQYELNKAKR